MFAIVEASGRQYRLEAGKFVDIDLIPNATGEEFVFERVLMLVNEGESTLGFPLVQGAKVVGKVLSHGKARKIIVYKQRPKKGTRKKQGHRQEFTRVLIDSIMLNDKVLAKQAKKEKEKSA
jgi:large subunit ribosomal protein L21